MSPRAPKKANTDKPVEPVVPITPDIAQASELDLDAILTATSQVDDMVGRFQEDAAIALLESKITKWTAAKDDVRKNTDMRTELEAAIQNEAQKLQQLEETKRSVTEAIDKLKRALESAGEKADEIDGAKKLKDQIKKLEDELPKIEKATTEKDRDLQKLESDLSKAKTEATNLETNLTNPAFDEVREMAEGAEKAIGELRKETEEGENGTFIMLVKKAHTSATKANQEGSKLLGKKTTPLKSEIDEVRDANEAAKESLAEALKKSVITQESNGNGAIDLDISDQTEKTLRRAVQFGIITEKEAHDIRKSIDASIDALVESSRMINDSNGKITNLNTIRVKNIRNPRPKRTQGTGKNKVGNGSGRRVASILTPGEEATKRAGIAVRNKKVTSELWLQRLNDSEAQRRLKGKCEKYIEDQGKVTIELKDSKTEGRTAQVEVPQKGIFRILINSTPVGVVRVKLDEEGHPTNEVIKIVTLEEIEKEVTDLVRQNDINNTQLFKSVHDRAMKDARATAFRETQITAGQKE